MMWWIVGGILGGLVFGGSLWVAWTLGAASVMEAFGKALEDTINDATTSQHDPV